MTRPIIFLDCETTGLKPIDKSFANGTEQVVENRLLCISLMVGYDQRGLNYEMKSFYGQDEYLMLRQAWDFIASKNPIELIGFCIPFDLDFMTCR